jgi:long-chain acyl-CoA synthetase
VKVRVVGDDGHDVAGGTQGELWVHAPTAMVGYWNRPDLTAAAFVSDDDGALVPHRRPGDPGRRRHAALLRSRRSPGEDPGVRLELEAVEAVLASAPGVVDAVVGPIGPSGEAASLVAAVVLEDGWSLDETALRRWCGGRLAAVAVPQRFDRHDSLPATSSGKVDRRQVRELLASRYSGEATTAPVAPSREGTR